MAKFSFDSLFTKPYKEKAKPSISLKEFWHGKKRLSKDIVYLQPTTLPAVIIKKQGDYPLFFGKKMFSLLRSWNSSTKE